MFFKYNGGALAIKLPINSPGTIPPGELNPDLQCFLVWSPLPGAGDIIIELDPVVYPYAFAHMLKQRLPSSTPLWEETVGPATAGPPVFHRPNLPSAIF